MVVQKIHILGEEEIVSMLGLLGLEGTVVGNEENFLKKFTELVNDSSMGIIIIAMHLKIEIIYFLLDFKQNNKIPFIFILPDIFKPNIEKDDIILNKIMYAIGDMVLR
ncbi:MAG: V-type ATP synthase subunit F [Promethearchaeota archaeon]